MHCLQPDVLTALVLADGPSVYDQNYFHVSNYPNNMPAMWHSRFEFLHSDGVAPIVLGEFGGRYEKSDKIWQDTFLQFIEEREIGFFYFALMVAGQSMDTRGLLRNDLNTPNDEILGLLSKAKSTDVLMLREKSIKANNPVSYTHLRAHET